VPRQIESGRRQSINQRRQLIVRQVIQKLLHRVDPLFAGRTSGYDNAFAALRD
jgi:ribosomal protein L17